MNDDIVRRATDLHRRGIVIDGHTDILMPIADQEMRLGERYALPDPKTWRPPAGFVETAEAKYYDFTPHTSYFQTMGQYDLPRFREGGVTAEGFAIFIDSPNLDRALHRALEMVYWLNREFDENPDFIPITSVADIERVKAEGKVGGILTFEGFEPLGTDLKLLDVFYSLGLRMATLTHSRRNYFADGTQGALATAGLTEPGRNAVRRMNELGVVIDLAHLAPAGCRDVLELSEAPVVLSHCSPKWLFRPNPLANGRDSLAREVIEGVARTGGVVGVIAYGQADLDDFLNDIETLVSWIGVEHVGLGTDFFGIEAAPAELSGIQDLLNVTRALVERGFSDEAILGVLGQNYLRVFESVWERGRSQRARSLEIYP